MRKIVLSELDYAKSKSREGLEEVLNRVVGESVIAFWEESHPTIIWMVAESIPFLTAIKQYLDDKPELFNPEFITAAFILKGKHKEMTPFEIIELAAKEFAKPNG